MYTSQGANSLLVSSDLDEDVLESTGMVFVSGFSMETTETSRAIAEIASRSKQMGIRVAVGGGASNLISRRSESFRDLVEDYADYLILNEKEASVMADCEDPGKAIRILEPLCDFIIITRGSRGSTALISGETRDFSSPKSEIVDSTGAGDVFAGVLLAGIQGNLPWPEVVPRAHLQASRSTERLGPR
jgi:sugar/nucleoside kinase (ribokinase family)